MKFHSLVFVALATNLVLSTSRAQALVGDTSFDVVKSLASYNVVWNEPGQSSSDSMPLGNGDTSLNVWTEPNGDMLFYIGKADAWTENPNDKWGLAKLGRVRVSVTRAPLGLERPSSRP